MKARKIVLLGVCAIGVAVGTEVRGPGAGYSSEGLGNASSCGDWQTCINRYGGGGGNVMCRITKTVEFTGNWEYFREADPSVPVNPSRECRYTVNADNYTFACVVPTSRIRCGQSSFFRSYGEYFYRMQTGDDCGRALKEGNSWVFYRSYKSGGFTPCGVSGTRIFNGWVYAAGWDPGTCYTYGCVIAGFFVKKEPVFKVNISDTCADKTAGKTCTLINEWVCDYFGGQCVQTVKDGSPTGASARICSTSPTGILPDGNHYKVCADGNTLTVEIPYKACTNRRTILPWNLNDRCSTKPSFSCSWQTRTLQVSLGGRDAWMRIEREYSCN